MMFLARRAWRALGLPDWWPYLAVALAVGSILWYIDYSARTQERAIVTGENAIAKLAEKKAELDAKATAEKHFAERASEAAAAIAALDKIHAAAVASRDEGRGALAAAWETVVIKEARTTKARPGTTECWPVTVVTELRK